MNMQYVRRGKGKPLLLIHGLGGSHRSWNTIIESLVLSRDVIAVDLPGFGATPPLKGEVSIRTLSDAVAEFIKENNLTGIDVVGSSMGARLVMELARRGGIVGAVVSLDPGGFWRGLQRHYFYTTIAISIKIIRILQPAMPAITSSKFGRFFLFSQFSPRPSRLSPKATLDEMRDYNAAVSFDPLLTSLAYGATQMGVTAGTIKKPMAIGWGRKDLVCLPSQSKLALELFPDATLQIFERCGHFPHWDRPEETISLILKTTA